MDPVDGNAIGGLLIDVFGTEMTAASTTCGTCGSIRPVAELVVYQRAPGAVVRCRTCGSVLMVLVRRTDAIGVDLSGLASLSQPGSALSRQANEGRPACRTSRQLTIPGGRPPKEACVAPTRYRITVRGRLTQRLWCAFEELNLEPDTDQMALVGEIRDQSHLHGVLDLIRGLGLELVSVETDRATPERADEGGAS